MTYKTRQEVLRAAADWMDVCEKAGVEANCKWGGVIGYIKNRNFSARPEQYEFPLALLEGKEVWVGSELWHENLGKVTVRGESGTFLKITTSDGDCKGSAYNPASFSWNPPKPKTVMVEHLVRDAEEMVLYKYSPLTGAWNRMADDCKKALESLK